jgi:PAS domain S-box-containing protein
VGPFQRTKLHLSASLRGKTLFILLAVVLGLVGGLYALARVVLLRGFENIEEDFARQNLDRASSALSNELATLDRTTTDYSSWDHTYKFMRGEDPKYVKSDLLPMSLGQLRLNFVVLLDKSGRKVFSRSYNLITLEEVPLPDGLESQLQPGAPLVTHSGVTSKVLGILMLPDGPALVDSRPILTSESEGPMEGTLVMGRMLDSDEILRLGEMTRIPIDIGRLDSPSLTSDFREAAAKIPENGSVVFRLFNDQSLGAYQVLKDVQGKPVLLLRIQLPRKIFEQGQTSLLQFLLLLLAASMAFGAVTLYLLERMVISRVAGLSDRITQIGASGDLAARLEVTGSDEIGFLGNAVNGMLEDLDRSQTERHEGRTRLGVMVDKMPLVLWTTDAKLNFTSAVGAGLSALGVKPGELEKQSLFEFFKTNDTQFPPIAAHLKALGGESTTYELNWDKHTFESHVQSLRDSEGELLGVIGVALDITDRKQLADQLRVSQKMQAIGELAGGVAHDFNNLLMVVKGHGELLLSRLPDPSPLRHNVEQMEKAADRAATLTRQLLAFSRKQVLQPRVLDLNEVVSGMIQMFSRVIGENIEMAFLPGTKLGRVKADPGQIEQVLLNLVVNGRDAMPDGGRLTIETSNIVLDEEYAATHTSLRPGPYVMLTVSDTGCGMDAQTQSRIFEPFFTTKEHGKGTGLGLATVYGVVKQSGGFIYVYSEVEHGTTFKIYLPLVTADAEKLTTEKVVQGPPRGTETILFVEDEESVRSLVRDFLETTGYKVLEATDGIHALDVAAAHKGPIHILITDVVMPRLSGRELAVRLSAERKDVKILYISGYTDDSVFRHGVLEGGVSFLQKPFNLKSLAQKIREVLDGQPANVVLQ